MPAKTVPDEVFVEAWRAASSAKHAQYLLEIKGYSLSFWSVTSKASRLRKEYDLQKFKGGKVRNGQA